MRLAIALLLIACGGKTTETPSTIADASLDAAADTGVDYTACAAPGDCVLAARTCCGVCGAPTINDVAAVHEAQRAAYSKSICPVPQPCPDCASANEPNLQAFCRSNRCAVVDVRKDDLSSCATDADCMLRYEACCECGASGDFNIIAIARARASDYARERCKPMTACPECAPGYPATLRAVCDAASKHCVVRPT